ncbi:MAG: NAD-dependent malic enzyme [Dehalococcoidia bacterium]|nr:NAD-dependent malic enzyme [Dehalococcoidia bacterium]
MITDRLDRLVKQYPDRTNPGAGYQLLLRLRMDNLPGMHGKVATVLGDHGAQIIDIDIADVNADQIVRDFIILCDEEKQAHEIVDAVQTVPGVEVQHASDRTFQLHRRGKIEVANKVHIRTNAELAHVYTPGVGRVSMAIHNNPDAVWSLTIKPNTIAVVSDGTAVLGLGDIGPEAAMPVMEGKSMLFKSFADIDAWPLCLDTKDTEEIIRIVKAVSPSFGGILLEDISAPRCFEIEDRLREELDIPVFHDDQHGTAVVVLAALINSLKIINKRPEDLKVCVLGVGASGVACSKIMMNFGVKNVIGFDRQGAVYKGRPEHMNTAKEWFAEHTNPEGFDGSLEEALQGADMFLGLSGPNLLNPEWVDTMAQDAIVFALANPIPEVMPYDILGKARVIATGRSDFPNQINNVLCFPGLFRGALDAGAKSITEEMKIVAARAIAETIPDELLTEDYILPSVFNEEVVTRVSEAVAAEAVRSGNVRKKGSRVFI